MSLKEKVDRVLDSHNMVHLATLDADGRPCVRGVDFAVADGEGAIVFITHKMTRKVQQIKDNPQAAFAIDHDCPDWQSLQELVYIKGTGTAAIVEDPGEIQKIFGLIISKFPFLKDLPGDPADFVGVRVDFDEVLVTDNSVSFGHTEAVQY